MKTRTSQFRDSEDEGFPLEEFRRETVENADQMQSIEDNDTACV